MIRLYTLEALLTPQNRSKVHPLLFDLYYFERAHPSVNENYKLVDRPDLADALIFPFDYFQITTKEEQSAYKKLYKLAESHHKKLMVYTAGDYGKSFYDSQIIVWRTGGFKNTNDKQTIILPAFIDDPVQHGQIQLKNLPYSKHPNISFTGFATAGWKEQLRIVGSTLKNNLFRKLGKDDSDTQFIYNSASKRFRYLQQLEASRVIDTDFIFRNKYRAGAHSILEREKTTQEFFQNLNNSPYTFCLRGAGNFSVRFYESLACGRIPVLVDTNCSLPLEERINWEEHICLVQPSENVVEKLIAFHRSFDESSFIELQQSNRKLYEKNLVRHHYFCHIHDRLKAML
ncbi:exostosin domain-containing protein [Nonlabens antarcticus]|uniref:exostosin domain-containing protein n=1 Tax=Nonlabens antarcticus TaxID=392714 RepID=UPI001891DCB4|nr:exostosin family protein [Nonlabens antarcticus]